MALADWVLSENRGGYTQGDRDAIKQDTTTPQWVYSGLGAPRGGSTASSGSATSGGAASGRSSGTGGTSASGGAAVSGGGNVDGAYDALAAFLAAQQRARDEAYRAAKAQQDQNYQFACGQLDAQTNKALQEAYVNKMLGLLRLPQDMAAQGLGGGAAETTLGSLYNNYGSARNNLEVERQSQLAGLLNTYQNNLAQLAAQRATGAETALSAYTTQLAKLMANNTPDLLSLSQGAGDGSASLYYRLRKMLGWDEEE